MNVKNPFLQTVLLIGAAIVFAIVANGFASRTRRLVLPGHYPNATTVPEARPAPAPIAPAPAPVAPAPVTDTIVPESTTTVATTTTTTTTAEAGVAPQKPAAAAPAVEKKPAIEFTPHPDKAYVELGGDDVAALYKAGALFLDARRTSVFEEGHIAGARSFPVWEADIDDRVNALFGERSEPADQNKPIVIYCSGGACEDSHMLAQKLWNIQFNNVYVYKDGFPDWQKRGGAVHKGAQP